MNNNALLKRAIELVNSDVIKGFTAVDIKKAANNDIELFKEYLRTIAEQANDPRTLNSTKNTYSEELVQIAQAMYNQINEDKIKGGKADNTSLEDIAKKFDFPVSKLKKELEMGIKVEMEHTNNKKTAQEIAMDHLTEMPDYYTRLNKMEKTALSKWSKKEIKETRTIVKKLLKNRLKNL